MPGQKPFSILRDAAIIFLGILAATWLLDGIQVQSMTTSLIVALVLVFLNMIVKPLLVLFTLPFVIFTFGLGILLINAVLLYMAGALVPGFEVASFGTAFLGALIISLTSLLVNLLLVPKGTVKFKVTTTRGKGQPRRNISDRDAIDV